jgi:serine/threonine protein kinase
MQPAIPLGTLLQKRYRVTKILGQGGFGRTYLAQDTACFDELCVLKEFTPNERGRDSLKKARELFGREAKTLHRISHPQIPSFRANFEEAKRLFLVQEYAEGKTYAKILGERIRESKTFSEEEAINFLYQMLPILTNIHNQGIIHRDISPDNIILRESDQLPVLIDFGVVKAGVKDLEAAGGEIGQQGTTVGKAGYAPNEQLQTGEAYANSDLYALAVTVVVMMTGRKPESLIDKSTMTWKWQQLLPTISPWFAKVLMRMMSYRPNNRYQSAKEVSQALRAVEDVIGSASGFAADNVSPSTGGQASNKSFAKSSGNKYKKYTSKYRQRSQLWTNPWVLSVGSGTFLLALFMIFKSFFMPGSDVEVTPKPLPPSVGSSVNPTNSTPMSSPLVSPASSSVSVTVSPSSTSTEIVSLLSWQPSLMKQGSIRENQTIIYQISNLLPGQKLIANLEGVAKMSVLAPNRAPIDSQSQKVNKWQGNVSIGGDYYIEISLPSELRTAVANYKLTLSGNNVATTPIPTASSNLFPGIPPLDLPSSSKPGASNPSSTGNSAN